MTEPQMRPKHVAANDSDDAVSAGFTKRMPSAVSSYEPQTQDPPVLRRETVPPVQPTSTMPAAAAADNQAPAGYQSRRAVPSEPYVDEALLYELQRRRKYGKHMWLIPTILTSLAFVIRSLAIVLCVLVLANALARSFLWSLVVQVTGLVTQFLPNAIAGMYPIPTVFGGTFRTDFAIAAIVLFLIDFVCMRLAKGLRGW